MSNFAYMCKKAILPFNELPSTLTGSMGNAFYECEEARFTITSIPEGVTSLSGTFYNNKKATIKLNKLPDNITSLATAFCYTQLEMNLDEVASNAPEGGYAALTNLSSAFFNCPGVTGSRSRFLAACPNATTNNLTFTGTNTTE